MHLQDDATLREQLAALQRHNAELEAQVRQRTFELQVLYDLSHQIGYTLNYDDLFRLMLQHLHRVVPYVVSGSFLMLEEPYELFVQYTRPLNPSLLEDIHKRMIATLNHMREQKITPGQVRLRTYEVMGSSATRLPVSNLGSVFQVPLIIGHQREAVGLLFIGSEQPDAFSEDQVRILYTVANQASVGIQQLRALLASEEQRMESLVTSLPDGVLLVDDQRHIVLVNNIGKDYLSLLGVRAYIGERLTHLAQQSLEPLFQPYAVGGHEVEMEQEDGTRWTFELAAQPMTVGPQIGGWSLVIRNITGRKRAEEEIRHLNVQLEQRVVERTTQLEQANRELQAERDLLQSVMETSPVGIMVADRTGKFIFANPRAERVLGVSKDTILQRYYNSHEWGITDYEGQPINETDHAFTRVMTHGLAISDVRQAITYPDGKRGLLSINAAPLCSPSGKVRRVVFTVRDVTRRVRAEEALRLSEAKLRLITMQMPSVLWTTDTNLCINGFMGAGLAGLGFDANTFTGRTVCETFGMEPDSAAAFAHQRALRGLSGGYETQLQDREFEVRVEAMRNKDGQIIGCIGLALDITERKHTEEQIRKLNTELEQRVIERTAQLEAANQVLESEVQERKRAEEELRRMHMFLTSVLENIPDMIYVKDAHEFRFVLINKATEEMVGISREQMIGKTVYDLLPRETADLFMERDQNIIRGDVVDMLEEHIHLQDRGDRVYHTRLIPVFDDQGKPEYTLGISADITESKQAQQELKKAWKAAEAATQAKSEFLANMSHEIRTPLNAIVGMTNLLLDTTLTLDQHDFAETIRVSSNALLAIINDVLDFSKIEAGKMELNHYPFNLYDCITESLELVSSRAAEKHINLSYTIAEQTPIQLMGDMGRLRQILVNLLSNAVKFTESGDITVHVDGRKQTQLPDTQTSDNDNDNGNNNDTNAPPVSVRVVGSDTRASHMSLYELHIAVHDTGIGIPSDRLERLFRSFSQVDTSTTRKYGGTGLGLAISKNLAELMGGKMWVESTEGAGSTFHFTFLAEGVLYATAETDEPMHQTVDGFETQPLTPVMPISHLINQRVLIVNDNDTNRHILTRQIVSWGMLPCVTTSPDEALIWIDRQISFDLVLIDVYQSDMAGVALAEQIRARQTAQTIIVCLPQEAHHQLEPHQMTTFSSMMFRPIKSSQLYDTLVQVSGGRESPVSTSESGQHQRSASAQAPAPDIVPMGVQHPLRILLVEDNQFNQKVALRFLQKIGYQADIAMNGLEALDALKKRPYDAILMDVQMPDMDGMEATRCIREQWAAHEQPYIIAMTAHALRGDRERCLDAGMDDYISKPVQIEDLMSALAQVKPVTAATHTSERESG